MAVFERKPFGRNASSGNASRFTNGNAKGGQPGGRKRFLKRGTAWVLCGHSVHPCVSACPSAAGSVGAVLHLRGEVCVDEVFNLAQNVTAVNVFIFSVKAGGSVVQNVEGVDIVEESLPVFIVAVV